MDGAGEFQGGMRDLNDSDWRKSLEDIGETEGYFEPLGARHFSIFADAGPVLLVSFESRTRIRALQDDQLPYGLSLARTNGWSSLSLVAEADTWFRDAAVHAYFDRLIDEAFFEDFDRVVFYGEGACAYAACAYSVAAPGATVIALRPQATLEPLAAGWDDRFVSKRRLDSTAAALPPRWLEAAGAGYVFYDLFERLDAMHAALFARPGTSSRSPAAMGIEIEWVLAEDRCARPAAGNGGRRPAAPAGDMAALRARRDPPRYLRMVIGAP
ncbi:MAG: phosphoadenosine phosphosulfate reductase [Paracoccaceae bacterium]